MKIVIVEDHFMFREVLRKVCEQELGHDVVGEAGDGISAVEVVIRTRPELVLLDLYLPGMDGFSVVFRFRQQCPDTRVLVLSSRCDDYTVFCAERARVQGFVDKNTNSVASLGEAITRIAAGRVSFSDAFLRTKAARHQDPRSFDKLLTERERTVVALVGMAQPDEQIAQRLAISVETVQKHRLTAVWKLGLASRTDLVRYARDRGFTLAPPEDAAMLP